MASTFQKVATLLVVSTSVLFAPCGGVGLHKNDNDYCYTDPTCGPGSDHWSDLCQEGLRQSPISLPYRAHVLPGVTGLHLDTYRCNSFRMQNNGKTVHVEFLEDGDGSGENHIGPAGANLIDTELPFPHPLSPGHTPSSDDDQAYYKFEAAHFHWGHSDDHGSEHCFDNRCFSMELHLVHHLSTYESMKEALESGDSNALAVIAVMLDVTPAAGQGNEVLAPIVNNMFQIEEPSHDDWTYVNAPLDLTPLLITKNRNYVYTYKGSLTTPECNEQVNWYVFKRPIAISHQDVQSFRFIRDSRGGPLLENHRPIQKKNGRPVYLSAVQPVH